MLILFLQMKMKLKVYESELEVSINKIKNNVNVGAITLGSKGSVVFENKLEYHVDQLVEQN